MLELVGKYTSAKVFTDNVEEEAIQQIYDVINSKAFDGQTVRIMPDCHAGRDICIGFCSTIGRYVNPNTIGVDIGCSMTTVEYNKPLSKENYELFNHRVLKEIGFGFNMSPTKAYEEKNLYAFLSNECNKMKSAHPELFECLPSRIDEKWISDFCKRIGMKENVFYNSINSVGGGNHFVEYGEGVDDKGNPHYGVTIHCGSRNLGVKVCEYWANIAKESLTKKQTRELTNEFKDTYLNTHENMKNFKEDLNAFLESKKEGKINGFLNEENMVGYFCDMVIAMAYAKYNHLIITQTIEKIMSGFGLSPTRSIRSVHNYIDFSSEKPIIRKGAIRSYIGEEMIVPFNMRDGLAICEGKSNEDWLCSCAHGAGRIMSRNKAKETLSMEEFSDEMSNVYSTTVCKGTIDESPMAYKNTEEIKNLISETCTIKYMLVPKINIKAVE